MVLSLSVSEYFTADSSVFLASLDLVFVLDHRTWLVVRRYSLWTRRSDEISSTPIFVIVLFTQ